MRNKIFYLLILFSITVFILSCVTQHESRKPESRKSLYSEGKEYFTLLSVSITPEIITSNGSDLIIEYKTNIPIEKKELIIVIKLRSKEMTEKRIFYKFEMSQEQIKFRTSNTGGYKYSGVGSIEIYLATGTTWEELLKGISVDEVRVSNIVSVPAIFE